MGSPFMRFAGDKPVFLAAGAKTPFAVRDNTKFVETLDAVKVIDVVKEVSTTVVLVQEPAPGERVPAGTAITLTVMPKSKLPLDAFKVPGLVKTKWKTVEELETGVKGNEDLKGLVASESTYATLSQADRVKADAAIGTLLGDEGFAAKDPGEKTQVYESIALLHNL